MGVAPESQAESSKLEHCVGVPTYCIFVLWEGRMRKNRVRTWCIYPVATPADTAALRVVSVGNERCWLPYFYSRPNGWQVEVLLYTLSGAGIGHVGEERGLPCRPSSILFCPKNLPYSYEVDPDVGHWEYRWVEFDGPWARQVLEMMALRGVYLVPDCPDGESVVSRLFTCLRNRGERGLHSGLGMLIELLAAAERALRVRRSEDDRTERRMATVTQYVMANVADPIGVPDLARVAGMSRTHFSRVFKASVGVAPGTYLRRYRMNRAQKLLRSTRMTTARVGAAVGYPVVQHFSTVFKRETGLTPSGFRVRRS